jgi:YVTN family beta-propeller protein
MALWRWAVSAAALLLIFAGSPAGAAGTPSRVYVHDGADNTLVVVDPATGTVVDQIAFDSDIVVEVRPDGREIYVAQQRGEKVVVLSTTTHAVLATIPMPGGPVGVVFAPDGRTGYVSNSDSGTVTVIDTASRRITGEIPLGLPATARVYDAPAIAPDGRRLYVGTDTPRTVTVLDTASRTAVANVPTTAGGIPASLYVAPDGRHVVAETGHVVDTSTNTIVRRLALAPVDAEFTPDSAAIYFTDACAAQFTGALMVMDFATGQVVRTVIAGGSPWGFDLTSDGSRLYVALGKTGGVAVVDTATDRVLDTFGVVGPGDPPPLLGDIDLSDTAPPVAGPGRRFAPKEQPFDFCGF